MDRIQRLLIRVCFFFVYHRKIINIGCNRVLPYYERGVGSTNGWFPDGQGKNRGLIMLKVCFSGFCPFHALIGLISLVLL